MAAAPATDAATAEAIAGLPAGFAKRLVLDMVLSAGKDGRLLIGSLPDDGEMYFLVLCRVERRGLRAAPHYDGVPSRRRRGVREGNRAIGG